MRQSETTPATETVRVWDLPTRGFHWALAGLVVASVISAKVGGNAMAWHFRFGYAIFTLLAFRLVWGFVGGRWSRFASFVYAPATLWRYLRHGAQPREHLEAGHNPLGALSVFALLAILLAQVGSGLFADDEIASTGPLIKFVSGATSLALTKWHKTYGQWLIVSLVALHVVAILYYLWRKRQNLIVPMILGDKALPAGTPASRDGVAQRSLAAVVLLACAAGVIWLVRLGN